jgi:hypothetical protein
MDKQNQEQNQKGVQPKDVLSEKNSKTGPSVDRREEEGSSVTRPGRRPGKTDESGATLEE